MDKESYSEPFGAANLSLGLSRSLEAGLNVEAGYGSALGGLSALWASSLGNFGLAFACSLAYEGVAAIEPSLAARVSWRYDLSAVRYAPRLGFALSYRGANFRAPAKEAGDYLEPLFGLSGQISQTLSQLGGNLGLSFDLGYRGGDLDSVSVLSGFSWPMRGGAAISLSLSADWGADLGLSTAATISLNVNTSGGKNLNFCHDLISTSDDIDISATSDSAAKSQIAFHGEGLVGDSDTRGLSLAYRAKLQYTDLSAAAFYSADLLAGESRWGGRFSATTGFVFAGGYLVQADAYADAMAILLPASALGLEKVDLLSLNGNMVSSDRGKAVYVPSLRAYRPYFAAIEMPESPPEVIPSPKSVEILPDYKSVTIIRVGAAPSIAVRGRLVDASGKARANLVGDILNENGVKQAFSGVFTDEEGIFECYDLDVGYHMIKWADGSISRFRIAVDEKSKMIELGDLVALWSTPGQGG